MCWNSDLQTYKIQNFSQGDEGVVVFGVHIITVRQVMGSTGHNVHSGCSKSVRTILPTVSTEQPLSNSVEGRKIQL